MSHRYYSPLRPLSLGTFPKPQGNEILHIENFEERQNVPEIARQAWGYIEYKEALTEIDTEVSELQNSNGKPQIIIQQAPIATGQQAEPQQTPPAAAGEPAGGLGEKEGVNNAD